MARRWRATSSGFAPPVSRPVPGAEFPGRPLLISERYLGREYNHSDKKDDCTIARSFRFLVGLGGAQSGGLGAQKERRNLKFWRGHPG